MSMNNLNPLNNPELNKKPSKENERADGIHEIKIANSALDMNTGENFNGIWKSKHM